jgi:hypothetical protein
LTETDRGRWRKSKRDKKAEKGRNWRSIQITKDGGRWKETAIGRY